MGRNSRFWDRIAERYARKPVADEAAYQRKLELTRAYLRPDSQVLEFGCGTGSTAIAHAPHAAHILATDISSGMLDIARRKAAEAQVDNVTFEQATLEELDIPDGSLDVVLGLSILHLLEDRDAAIARVRRLLKPGGIFVTSTACLGDSMKFFRFIGPIGHFLGLIPMVRVFTRDELRTSIVNAGFDIVEDWLPDGSLALFLIAKKPG